MGWWYGQHDRCWHQSGLELESDRHLIFLADRFWVLKNHCKVNIFRTSYLIRQFRISVNIWKALKRYNYRWTQLDESTKQYSNGAVKLKQKCVSPFRVIPGKSRNLVEIRQLGIRVLSSGKKSQISRVSKISDNKREEAVIYRLGRFHSDVDS